MRKKKALINSAFSLLLEIVTVISGFILPRAFIGAFGSEVNGLTQSITSFIAYITLLQSGVGTVARAALYKPLAIKDHEKLCVILKTLETFFRKIALITVGYIALLAIAFPTLIAPEAGDFLFTASLVVIIGVSTAAQYFFGITYQMLLEADQRSHVYSAIQILSVIVNTVLAVILIKMGCSVQIVKLGSAVVFVLRPLALSLYTRRKYKVRTDVAVDNSLIKQRWDGFAQAIAYFIHTKTDIFVLTVFARISEKINLALVSVYSVYAMVTAGLTSVVRAVDSAVMAAFGNIIALDEQKTLKKTFAAYSTFIHMLCTVLFATASITVFRFIGVYVKDITDAPYIQPVFGLIIIAAEYLYCLRLPYNSIIYAAGKFRETRNSAIIEAAINIVISVALILPFGLIGVAIGTFAAMAYRTVAFIVFLQKNVISLDIWAQIKRYAITFVTYAGLITAGMFAQIEVRGYLQWGLYAAAVLAVCAVTVLAVNLALAHKDTMLLFRTLLKRGKKKKQAD